MRMVVGGMIPGLSRMSLLSAPTWPRTTWPGAGLPPAGAPNKSGRRSSTRSLHCMCAADWTDGSRAAVGMAAAASVPSNRAEPPDHYPSGTGGDLPKQWPAKGDPRLASRATRRHKTRASHGRGLQRRHASPLSPLTAGLLPFIPLSSSVALILRLCLLE